MKNNDGDINFIKSFSNWHEVHKSSDCPCGLFGHDTISVFTDILAKAESDPFKSGKSFTTLNNYAARDAEHHQLLREYGFPSEQPPEGMRYTPVIETETTEWGIPLHPKPPWVVNEAGQSLGDRLDEDSPGYKQSAAYKAMKAVEKSDGATARFLAFYFAKEDNPFAIATAQAQKLGYENFKGGSAGDKHKDQIAEAVKSPKTPKTPTVPTRMYN